jgi:aspartate racemase
MEVIRGLKARGAQACILGCTEIELLVKQEHIPDIPLLPSAEIHIQAAANLLLGTVDLADLLPPGER